MIRDDEWNIQPQKWSFTEFAKCSETPHGDVNGSDIDAKTLSKPMMSIY